MSKKVASIAEEILNVMNRRGINTITYRWPQFYELVERERIKEGFQHTLAQALEQHSLLVSYGKAVVLVAKDYDFAPAK